MESLLIFYCGKNSRRKKKVKQVLSSLQYNEITKEYFCKSTTQDKTWSIIYSNAAKEWKCNCPYVGFVRYRLFEDVKDRNRLRQKTDCCHIIAAKIHKALKLA